MPTKKRKNSRKHGKKFRRQRRAVASKTTKNISSGSMKSIMIQQIKSHLFKIILSILIVILIILSLRFIGTTGKAVLAIAAPSSCSESEIKGVWDSVMKESSSGSIIFTGSESSGECSNYLAYKISGNKAYLLIGSFVVSPYLNSSSSIIHVNSTSITAVYGNFTQEYLSILRNITSADNLSSIYIIPDYVSQRNKTLSEAEQEFKAEISMNDSQSWQSYTDESGNTEYVYAASNGGEEKSYYNFGTVLAKYYFGQFDFIERSVSSAALANLTCNANWTEKQTPCIGSEKRTRYYTDANNCPNAAGKPSDEVIRCDFNNDGLYGHPSAFNTTITGLSLVINGTSYSPTQNYLNNATKKIEIKGSGNRTLISFDWPFSIPLNLYSMYFKKQNDADARGYLIVGGISASKTITIDKKMSNSNAVCIKNQEISSIDEISIYCNKSQEVIVSCPGNKSGYSCSPESSYFKISGLTNSGVIEMYYNDSEPTEEEIEEENCTPDWQCTEWADCINLERKRTCADANSCNTTAGKPAESEACTPPCSASWQCTNWTACDKKTLNQTRTCSDINNCGVQEGKPAEKQACEIPKSNAGKTIIAAVTILAALIILGIAAWYLYSKKSKSGGLNEAGDAVNPPPYAPPAYPPQYPQQVALTPQNPNTLQ